MSSRRVEFAWEPLQALLDAGLHDLVVPHWHEVHVHLDEMPLAVDYVKYQELEDKGLLYLMGARRGDKLVGYASYMVMPHLHYCKTLHAMNDAIFVLPQERGAGIGLVKAAEEALGKLASPNWIRIIYHAKLHVEAERGTLARVFEHLGYKAFETSHDKMVRL